MKKKVVLAFSGGLDTSFAAKYLSEDLGYEVHTAIANTGGFSPEELTRIEQRAMALGAASHATLDVTKDYYDKSIRYMIAGNVLRIGGIRACIPGHCHHRVCEKDRCRRRGSWIYRSRK